MLIHDVNSQDGPLIGFFKAFSAFRSGITTATCDVPTSLHTHPKGPSSIPR